MGKRKEEELSEEEKKLQNILDFMGPVVLEEIEEKDLLKFLKERSERKK